MRYLNNEVNIAKINNEFKITLKFNENGLSFNDIIKKSFKDYIISAKLK